MEIRIIETRAHRTTHERPILSPESICSEYSSCRQSYLGNFSKCNHGTKLGAFVFPVGKRMQFNRVATVEIPGFIRSQIMQPGYFIFFQEIEDRRSTGTVPPRKLDQSVGFVSPPEPTPFFVGLQSQGFNHGSRGFLHLISTSGGCLQACAGKMVGTVRFELTASCSQSRRANQTTLRPGKTNIDKRFIANKQRNSIQHLSTSAHHDNSFFRIANNASTYHDALIRL